MLRLRFLLATAIACLSTLGIQGQSVLNVSADFASIQDAIDAANPGDTLVMSAGTFSPSGTIELNKSGLVLRGAGAEETTIDIGGFNAWGIHISADSVMCQNFSIQGNAAINQQYAIHTTPGIAYARVLGVTVTGNHRTGVDFNGVSGGVIRDVTSTGAAYGFGISISSCEDLIVRNITTSGNAWGNVGVYPAQTQYQGAVEAPYNIRFLDDLDLEGGVITVQPGELISGGVWDPMISTTDNTDAIFASPADVRVPEAMHYTAQATRTSDGLDNRIVGTPEDVLATMALIEGSGAFGPQTFTDLETGETFDYIVGCTDSTSCSYEVTATVLSTDSCTYPAEDYLDCAGECLEDADEDGLCDAIDGCSDSTACNYDDADATECLTLDAINECGGDCAADSDNDGLCDDEDNCMDTTACNFNSGSNGVCQYEDACGICGGTGNDVDDDGICDEEDTCVGTLDSCGVCNGSGAIYDCGCTELPAGACDCDGNVADAIGVCGGTCAEDIDMDGICDDDDDCVGTLDSCGVCNGPGATLDCGCTELPAGDCDCEGNQLDILGECGGDCTADVDGDGVCDTEDNCIDMTACNYANGPNGVCQYFDACGVCGGDGTDIDEDDLCDSEDNCTDILACNYDEDSNAVCQYLDACGTCGGAGTDVDEDGLCEGDQGVDNCADTLACNFMDLTADSCLYLDLCGICGGDPASDTDGDGVCDEEDLCTDTEACNFMNPFAMECLYLDTCGVCGGGGPDLTFQLQEVYAYDEADSGDVSSNAAMPLQLPWMGAGSYRLSGDATNFQQVNADPEYFTITIPEGYALTGIQLLEYDQSSFAEANDSISLPFGNGGFMGVGPGDSLPVINSPADFYAAAMALDGGALVGVNPGSQPGNDLLDDLGQAFNFYGLVMGGFDGPLGEGSWTFMFKEGNTMSGTEDAYVSWTFSLEVSEVSEDAYVAIYDCDGGCLTDSNDNGVCDELEVAGCMDPNALNYDAEATLSATCEYFSAGCVPVFDPEIADTVFVSCVDELPMEAPEQFAYDPCSPGTPAVDVLASQMELDTTTACAQYVTYRYVALNITYGLIGVEFQTYAVKDETGPEISSIPEDLVIACTDDSTAYGMVEAVDSCHDLAELTYASELDTNQVVMPACPGNYAITRMVTASDVCGNESSASYTITVRDLVPPVLGNVPANDSLSCEAPIPSDAPLHQDDCGMSTLDISMTTLPGSCPENYTLIRTFTAEDECGNQSSAIQEVVFTDTVAPMILTMPADLILACEDAVADSAITASDNCSDLMLAWSDSTVAGDCPQEYTIIRTHTAEDACGNSSSHVQTIDVVDEVAPEFTELEAFVTTSCGDALTAFASAEDTCSAVTLTFATFSAYGSAVPGQQIRLYTAMDECGNSTEGIQLVSFTDAANCSGCTNETAQNYDASAVLNDGSCDFGGVYTQGGDCNIDTDQDGVCDQLEIPGCQDSTACNYVAIATDPADCVYPEDPTRDCAGICLADEDGDGICDENEVEGCMDPNACNFDLFVTDSDPAMCDYGCQGCTYPGATNYDAGSTVDDGSCEFDLEEVVVTTCNGDADGDGQVGILDLLDVLDSFGTYCD